MDTLVNARLSVDSYREEKSRIPNELIAVDGRAFVAIRHFNDISGYQGVLYEDVQSGDLVLAHRGTEFGRQPLRDGVLTDLGMVMAGFNAQLPAAMKATEYAINYARDMAQDCGPLSLTVTGHSLGGTIGAYTAHHYGLRAETFDAYGAAGLVADLKPDVGHIVNHVRATDFVSAASRHVGEVRVYAAEQDVVALQRAGYANDERRFTDLRNPFQVMFGMGIKAHYSENFLQDNNLDIGGSIISAENQQRYLHNQPMFDKYRGDVAIIHDMLALPRNVLDTVVDHVRHAVSGRPMERDAAPLRVTGCDARQITELAPETLPLEERYSTEINSRLYRTIEQGVAALDTRLGREQDQASVRVTASLYAGARAAGMDHADRVLMGGTPSAPVMFAVQGSRDDPGHLRAQVSIEAALATQVATSLEAASRLPGRDIETFAMPPRELPQQSALAR